jgi:hypothetical protein
MRFLILSALITELIMYPGLARCNTSVRSGEGRPADDVILRASAQTGSTADSQINRAITSMGRRGGVIWADYSANQTWATCPNWGTQNITLVLYPVTYAIASNCTIPPNVTLEFSHGSCLAPADGTTTTITGYFSAPISRIFCNAIAGHGTVKLASADAGDEGGQALVNVYPEWWGATPADATGATNTLALQAAIIGAYGDNRTNATSYPKYNRILHFSALYKINAELRVYHMIGFRWEGENQFSSGLRQQSCGLRIIDGQSIAYGRFENLRFENGCGGTSGAALVDIDYNRAQGIDLAPQNITFYDDLFAGNGFTDVGVLIAKSGGGAQGDNIRCYNCYFSGFTGAGWQVGGNNTGRNAGRYYAYNAIKEQIEGGDCQANPLFCIAVYGGSVDVDGMTMENDSLGFGTQTGFDMYCEGPQDRCTMRNVRSESHKLASGVGLIEHSRTLFQATSWYSSSRSQSLAGTRVPSKGGIISGTGQCGDGKYYQITSVGTFGGLGLTQANGGSTSTITVASGSWHANAFVGALVCIVSGAGNGQYMVVTANDTGTTITGSGGWQTKYYQLAIVNPDATSQFVVEPNWGIQTSSGTVNFALFDFQVIGGCSAGGSTQGNMGNCQIFDVAAPGGTSIFPGSVNRIENFFPSRTDWGGTGFLLEDSVDSSTYRNIIIERPDSAISVGGTGKWLTWGFRRNSGGNSFFSGPNGTYVGTQPLCWSYGRNGGGLSANDVCVGIRTDNNSTNSLGRAVLGILGSVGPVTRWGTNVAGVDLPISGGLGTGDAAPGGISFRIGTKGTKGSQVNDSNEVARIDVNGYKLPAFTFDKLPSAPNGYVVFCIDCNQTCTSGGGKGRTCFRENGAWTH